MNDDGFQERLIEAINFLQKQKLNSPIKSLDHLTNEIIAFSDLSSLILEMQISSFLTYLNKNPNDALAWYQYSEFLRYNTSFFERALEAAKRSVEICRLNLKPIGAISRNYLSLTAELRKFQLLEEELVFLCSEKIQHNHIINDLNEFELRSYAGFISKEAFDLIQKVKKSF